MSFKTTCLFFCIVVSSGIHAQQPSQQAKTSLDSIFKPVKWRSIGPFRGGRSVAATGVVGDPATYYMGTTGGGLWKTDDMGITWNNISDGYFKTGSVGAVAVAESDPNIVYAGMGEHPVRGVMTHGGDGVYKSTDAGKTWKKVGLDLTQHIARVVIDPRNPDIVFVAAQGALFSHSRERGIYKTTDGGISWKNVLYVDDKTGCAELSMDMNNPLILYAAMWEHGRQPWKVISGGPGSGLYKSVDGGETWHKMEEGLPREMGKMSISVCRSNSEKVYALIESDSEKDKGGLYVSNNAGKTWSQVTNDHRLIQRAWYYIEMFTDPLQDNTVYVMSAPALRSIDGGKTWEEMHSPHGDYHNLWINPRNSANMIISNDGGSMISFNKGKTWSSQGNMPTGQFYRINVDNQFPYRIYGGQQDNTSVSIASRELGSGRIGNASWTSSAGGESAFLAFDPENPRYVMGGSYQGTIEVLDTKAKASTNIMAAPIQYLGMDAKDMRYRFNWNAPIIRSQHEPNTFYHGAQCVLKTTDMGKTWTEASPDLTRNDRSKQGRPGVPYTNEAVGAENYGTLSYIMESPLEKGVIYTGSDDGEVYLTRDNGEHWQNVTPAGLAECLINAIEVSPFDKATAYIATTRYKFNDHTPGLYKTTDYGKTWTNISQGIPKGAFTRVIREDDQRRDLLFAGTETGLYLSWNGGKSWEPFQLNLPVTPITDLRVYKGNLIAATSGRAFWILDDLSLIRQYQQGVSSVAFYKPSPAYLANGSSQLDETDPAFTGADKYAGVNPANGIVMYYHLPSVPDSIPIHLDIRDEQGKLVRSFHSEKKTDQHTYDGAPPPDPVLSREKGMNRFVWDMRHATITGVPDVYIEASYAGHKVIPGKYRLELHVGSQEIQSEATILANPLYQTRMADYQLYDQQMDTMEQDMTAMNKLINLVYAKRKQLEKILATISGNEKLLPLQKAGKSLSDKMKAWDEEMVQRKSKAYDDVENYPNRFTADYLFLINQTESDIPSVNQPSLDKWKELNRKWLVLQNRGNEFLQKEIPAFNQQLWEAGIGAIWSE
ncbi:MAG: glycosyl hydrolase [Bacteroidota bacterium]|nr:glycosyl hydrolase [Bacteroidota bacterium]